MASWSITGSWLGRYWYDPSDTYPVPMPTVSFTLAISQGWFGRFHGHVQDDASKGGMPERGVIEGRISVSHLSFVKKMPVCYVSGGAGTITLRQYLRDTYQINLDEDVPHPGIHYEGEYDRASDAAKGWWQFESKSTYVRSRGQLLEIPFPKATGKWEMTRQSGV